VGRETNGLNAKMARNDGTKLEDEVYSKIESWLESGEIPVRAENCRIHRSKSYYSARRVGNIHFENVVEVFSSETFNAPEAQPSFVLIFECKDYARNIEIGVIDEFIGRTDQDFGFRVKPYLVTRSGFAPKAINAAKARGIGLIKILADSNVRFLLHVETMDRATREWNEFPSRVNRAFSDPDFQGNNESFYGSCDGYVFRGLTSMINDAIEAQISQAI
jgi:hypothetical protein